MKISAYILIAALTFSGFLVVFAPASLVWSTVQGDVTKAVPDLSVIKMGGSIWHGKSEIQFRQFPLSKITWEISPLKLLRGAESISITADGHGHSLDIEALITPSEGQVELLEGEFGSSYINSISEPYGLTFSGDLIIDKVSFVASKDEIKDASGTVHWSGGRVIVAGKDQPLDLPPLDGKLFFEKQLLTFDVTFEQASLLRISLNKQGWAHIAIKGRFFDIANLPRPDGTSPDETILLLEEKIL